RAFRRLGVRNAGGRRGRSALIVTGLMLGTAIIAAALATGDTMSQTIRSAAITALGRTDELVAAKGIGAALATDTSGAFGATGTRYFPQSYADTIARAARASGLVAAVAPVIFETVAVRDVTSRQNEPRVMLFASDPARVHGCGGIGSGGNTVALASWRPGEIYLTAKAAEKLGARAGDPIRILAGGAVSPARVRAVVRYEGGATAESGLLLPLGRAQEL